MSGRVVPGTFRDVKREPQARHDAARGDTLRVWIKRWKGGLSAGRSAIRRGRNGGFLGNLEAKKNLSGMGRFRQGIRCEGEGGIRMGDEEITKGAVGIRRGNGGIAVVRYIFVGRH